LPIDHGVGRSGGKRGENRKAAAVERAAPALAPGSSDHAILTPYPVRSRSRAVSSEAEKPAERSDQEAADESEVAVDAGAEAHAIGDAGDYAQVGEHVAAVLTSARQAAAELLAAARADAQRRHAEAQQKAEDTVDAARREADRLLDEAARIHSEAEAQSEETRASAEAYTEAARLLAEDERAKTLADAEESARAIRAEAERHAREIGTDALQRHEALVRDVGRSEERLQDLLTVFRAMTSELEALVKTEAESETVAEVEAPNRAPIDDALTPQRATRTDANSDVAAGGAASRRVSR
jgi:hypothetical protein